MIVKGHGRREAALQAGLVYCPVDLQEYESEAAEHADMIADNRIAELAEMDRSSLQALLAELKMSGLDMDLAGFSQAELDKHFLEERQGLIGDDEVPPAPKVAKTQTGDLVQLGDHLLVCGDSREPGVIDSLFLGTEVRAQMVFTDPPYNVDYFGGGGCDRNRRSKNRKMGKIKNDSFAHEADFEEFLSKVFMTIRPYVKGDVYCCMVSSMLHILYSAFARNGGHLSTFIIWVKNHFTIGMSNYQRQYEPILYGWFEGSSHYWSGVRNLSDIIDGDLMFDGDGVPLVRVEPGGIESDIWPFPKPKANRLHPTMKPVDLCRRAIVNSSEVGGIVLDVFGGSGSTLIACEKTKRRCRMVEMECLYCDVIISRWEAFSGQKARLIT